MQQHPDFDIQKLVELSRFKKYEATVVGFNILDKVEKLNLPKKLRSRKHAVQALTVLSEGTLQFGYYSVDEKQKLLKESQNSDAAYKNKQSNLYSNQAAPVDVDDSEEEEIPEEEPVIKNESDDGDEDTDDLDDGSDSAEEDSEE